MRSPIIAWKVILTAVIVLAASSELSAAGADSIVYQNDSTFTIEGIQNELQQDGEWIKVTKAEIDPEGVTDGGGFDDEINTEYVWRPRNMGPGWTPYSNGYWSYTNCGWMWTSFYSWGWRTYHYGRWWWSEYYGWVWSPGFIWAPAWVVWMYNDGYCGWYPISPRVRWHHDYGYRCHGMRYRVRHWTFCEKPKFHDPLHPPVAIVDPSGNTGIINTSTYNGNVNIEGSTVINKGPEKTDIESASGRKIEKVDVVKYNNVTEVTGVTNDGRNNSGKNTEEYNDTKKLYDKQYEYKENNGGKTQEKTSDGSGDKRVENKQDPNTNKENQNTRESEKKTYEKTGDKSNERSTEKKKDDSYKNNDGYKNNEKKSNDTYKEKQKDTYKDSNRSNEKRSDEKRSDDKRSNDNKQDSKPPKNDSGSKDNNGKK